MFTQGLENGDRFKLHLIATGSGAKVYALKDIHHDRAIVVQGEGVDLLEMVVASFAMSSGPFDADEVLDRVWRAVAPLAQRA